MSQYKSTENSERSAPVPKSFFVTKSSPVPKPFFGGRVGGIQSKAVAMVKKAKVKLNVEKAASPHRARLEAYEDTVAKGYAVINRWQNVGLCGRNPWIVSGFKAAHALMRSPEWKEKYMHLCSIEKQ